VVVRAPHTTTTADDGQMRTALLLGLFRCFRVQRVQLCALFFLPFETLRDVANDRDHPLDSAVGVLEKLDRELD